MAEDKGDNSALKVKKRKRDRTNPRRKRSSRTVSKILPLLRGYQRGIGFGNAEMRIQRGIRKSKEAWPRCRQTILPGSHSTGEKSRKRQKTSHLNTGIKEENGRTRQDVNEGLKYLIKRISSLLNSRDEETKIGISLP